MYLSVILGNLLCCIVAYFVWCLNTHLMSEINECVVFFRRRGGGWCSAWDQEKTRGRGGRGWLIQGPHPPPSVLIHVNLYSYRWNHVVCWLMMIAQVAALPPLHWQFHSAASTLVLVLISLTPVHSFSYLCRECTSSHFSHHSRTGWPLNISRTSRSSSDPSHKDLLPGHLNQSPRF